MTLLESQGLDAIVFQNLSNLRYLCGFSGSDGALLVAPGGDCFLCDSRYTTQARGQVVAAEQQEYRVKAEAIGAWLCAQGAKRIGFEAESLTVAGLERLQSKGPQDAEWMPLTREHLAFRACKDADEVAAIQEAAALNALAFAEVLSLIRPGTVERELSLALEFALKRRGGEEKAFDFIIASGPRGALPHGVASERTLETGDLVTIDFGTRVRGYHSDETVTVGIGTVDPRLRQIYDIVLEAHDQALAAVRPGVSLREVDAIARRVIDDAGYGDYFGHGLGHGVGLEVHEFPTLSPRSEDVAEVGMVLTIEPGIYVPDLGGVRIEDMVLVTAEGAQCLTQISKSFRSL